MRHLLFCCLILVLVTAAVAAPLAAQTSAPTDGAAKVEGDEAIDFLVERFGISQTEALERLKLQMAVPALTLVARERFPSTYAGVWIDQEHGGTIHVMFTEDAAASVDAIDDAFPAPERLVADPASFSYGHLMDTYAQLAEMHQERVASTGKPPFDITADIPGNIVTVTMAAPSEADRRWVQDSFGGAARVVAGSLSEMGNLDACDWRDVCDPSLRGGISIHSNFVGNCTSGFVFKRPNLSGKWLSTAGHCASFLSGPETWTQDTYTFGGDQNIGESGYWHFGGSSDWARIAVDSESFWDPRPWIRRTAGIQEMAIVAKAWPSALSRDMVVCRTGGTSGTHCGLIEEVVTSHYTLTYVLQTDYCGDEGDSGASVFMPYDQDGVVSGTALAAHSDSDDDNCTSTESSYATYVVYAEFNLDMELHCSQPPCEEYN